jgi:pimeloyl-ACP methyl ester carboxylesterase
MIALDQWKEAGKSFTWHGHQIFYREEGAGENLVCIHGFPTASWDWSYIWLELTKRYRVLALDMIGFGYSDKPRAFPYSIMQQATLHEECFERLGIKRAHILAHDYGDTVAQELLARFLERKTKGEIGFEIRSVCLLNGGIFPSMHRPRPMQRLLDGPFGWLAARLINRRSFAKSFSEIFGPATRPTPSELEQFWSLIDYNNGRLVFPKLIKYMRERRANAARWVGVLERPIVPMRFINGPEDPVSGAHMAEMYRSSVPSADLVLLDGIGHYPQVEAPGKTLQAFLHFTRRVEEPGESVAT